MPSTRWDDWTARIAAGGVLSNDELGEAAASPDLLSLGMLATGSVLTPIVMHAIFNAEMLLLFYAWP